MSVTNSESMIDSRDVIARIDELEATEERSYDEQAELAALQALADEANSSPDWVHGEALIREDHFTAYIEDLIKDCYEMPKEFSSGEWPWRHMKIDYEAAAEEAKADYMEVNFDGVTYLIRA